MKTVDQIRGEIPLFDVKLLDIGTTSVTVGTIVVMSIVMMATCLVSWGVTRAIRKAFELRGLKDKGTIGVVTRLTHYFMLGTGLFVALRVAGIDLTALFAASAIFAVAFGFAMQGITANFVSGMLLLTERVIKPDDVLQVDGMMVRVRDMGIRTTIVRTLDDEDLIIPNSTLVQSTVTNHTFRDDQMRLRVSVGVSYTSDLGQVKQVLLDAAQPLEWRFMEKDPVVLLTDFGNSAVNFEVSVWIEDPWKSRVGRSDLREAIWWALKDAGIAIAFPQLDLHVDELVVKSIQGTRATS